MKLHERAVFFFSGVKKTCDFYSRPVFKAIKLTFGQKKTRYEVDLCL